MNLSLAYRQFGASKALRMIESVQRTYARVAYFWLGPKHAWHMPAINDQPGHHPRGDTPDRLGASVSSPVHASEVSDA